MIHPPWERRFVVPFQGSPRTFAPWGDTSSRSNARASPDDAWDLLRLKKRQRKNVDENEFSHERFWWIWLACGRKYHFILSWTSRKLGVRLKIGLYRNFSLPEKHLNAIMHRKSNTFLCSVSIIPSVRVLRQRDLRAGLAISRSNRPNPEPPFFSWDYPISGFIPVIT